MIRNRYNQAPNLTQDTTWKSDKTQEIITYKRAMRLSVPSRWLQGCNEQTRQHGRHETLITNGIYKKAPLWRGQ